MNLCFIYKNNMFFSLPIEIQNIINSYNKEFCEIKYVIYLEKYDKQHKNNKKRLFYSKNVNKYDTNIKELIHSNLQNFCSHQEIYAWGDGDYHKPRYEYICQKCFKEFWISKLPKYLKIKYIN